MILNKGAIDGNFVFSQKTVELMTIPYFFQDGKIKRGLGWDISSPFSSPRVFRNILRAYRLFGLFGLD